ncbi:MAG: hypothetical protein LUF30_02975 [Lachnospiraceae bacterium]|nr:hypothetical protein [Lachnospiraceae bacterium]
MSTLTAGRDGRLVRCIVTDASGNTVTSDEVKMVIGILITAQPTDYEGAAGSTATFTIEALGTDLTYQWQYSDNNGKTWNTSTASSAKEATYTSTLPTERDGRLVRCILIDANWDILTSDEASMKIS